MEEIDLGVCPGQLFPSRTSHVAVLLPGAGYVPAAPLLWFARETAMARGWTVLQVWDRRRDSSDGARWATERAEAALDYLGHRKPVLIAKSITSLAMPVAVERELPGAWLTPLLHVESVRKAIGAMTAPYRLYGGTADMTWKHDFAMEVAGPDRVFEVVGGDHSLQLRTPQESVAVLDSYVADLDVFLASLE